MEIRPLLSALWRSRVGPILVAVQIAITLTVLVNAAFVIKQRLEANYRPTGIDIDNILIVRSEGHGTDYNHETTVKADLAYLNSLPGVIAAAASHALPQTFSSTSLPFSATPGDNAKSETSLIYLSSERIIEALGLKLSAGRHLSSNAVAPPSSGFSEAFGKWAPEVVITQALAKKVFPDGNALGKTLYVGMVNRSAQVVGVVEQMQAIPVFGPFADIVGQITFVPAIPPGPSAIYIIRAQPGRRDELMARIERELEQMQPGRFIDQVRSFTEIAARTRAPNRATSIMLAVVAFFVLALTALGIFGLAAYNVATRTRQIGTRRAIGAKRFHILRYFLVENWLITTAGVIVGCGSALAVGVMLSRSFQMPRLSLYYLVGGILVLWVLGLSAALIPARRAAAISPAIATRTV